MNERLPRKLAAILYADVAGYSRLTGTDEDSTHRRLGAALDLFERHISEHDGQVMHYAGDAVLARFDAVIDAVSCALAVQSQLRQNDPDASDQQKLLFRIGVNLGDVIEDRGEIYGDGVNIAARLETLAEPGGICVSESVRTALGSKLEIEYLDLGEQKVKNIAEPLRAYQIKPAKTNTSANLQSKTGSDELQRPSIAVLPFTNMSGETEQEYFSDGITEDIITALSRISGLRVIARNSIMVDKGQAVDIKQVGREMGVDYVLEGSVRKGGDRVRVTAQLIDAHNGHHLWADRYDRDLDDIFAVQDDITHKIMVEMRVKLSLGEKARMLAGRTHSARAWELQLRADELNNRFIRECNKEARRLAEQALQLDPEYVSAWTELGWTHCMDAICGWTESLEFSINSAENSANRALELETEYPLGLSLLAYVNTLNQNFDQAVRLAERSVELAPDNTECVAELAHTLLFAGRLQEATGLIEKAIRDTPMDTMWHYTILGTCHYIGDQLEIALDIFSKAIEMEPDSPFPRVFQIAALYEAGHHDEARQAVEHLLRIERGFSLQDWNGAPFKDHSIRDRILAGLRQAGLPG